MRMDHGTLIYMIGDLEAEIDRHHKDFLKIRSLLDQWDDKRRNLVVQEAYNTYGSDSILADIRNVVG